MASTTPLPETTAPEGGPAERISALSRKSVGRLLIAVSLLAITVMALCYNYQLLRASVILAHNYERPAVLRMYESLVGYKVEMSDFTINGANGPIQMRMYRPLKRNPAPMVLVHGLVASGNRHEYMNYVAQHLAKVGFLVIMPTLPGESHFEMLPSDLTVIADAVHWTAQYSGQKVSLVGNSFSGGLIIPAAVQPEAVGRVKVIFCNSGYYNLDSIGRYFIRDKVLDPDGRPYKGEPPGPMVIAAEYLGELVPKGDLADLTAAVQGYNANDGFELPANNPVMARLTPREREEFQHIMAADDPEFKARYRRVLERHKDEIAAISPSSVLPNLHIPLYVLHSSIDPVFPVGEVTWIQKATRGNPNVHVLVSPWVLHVKVGFPASPWQKFLVIQFCAKMLQEAAEVKPLQQIPRQSSTSKNMTIK